MADERQKRGGLNKSRSAAGDVIASLDAVDDVFPAIADEPEQEWPSSGLDDVLASLDSDEQPAGNGIVAKTSETHASYSGEITKPTPAGAKIPPQAFSPPEFRERHSRGLRRRLPT